MKIVKIIKTVLIAVALPILAGAATQRYIVDLSTEPAARFASRNFGERKEALARPEVQTHRTRIRTEQDNAAASIRALGGVIVSRTDTASNTLTVDLPEEKAASLSSVPGVKSYHKTRIYHLKLDQANVVHNFPLVYSEIGGMNNAGAGIKIAMLDTGIDITQPAFSDAGFQAPAGFPKVNTASDTMYTNNKVIAARSYYQLWPNPDPDNSASDEVGHGTSTADCAAGGATTNSPLGAYLGISSLTGPTFTGAAPGAYLGSYKIFGSSGVNDGATDAAILAAIDDAVNDGMDVINYSVGTFPPIPAALDDVAGALNTAVAAGVIVTAAAGNDGNGDDPGNPIQFDSADGNAYVVPELISTEGAQGVIQVGASSNQRAYGNLLTVGNSSFLVDPENALDTDNFNNPLIFTNVPIIDVATLDKTGDACNALPANSLNGAIALISLANYDAANDTCDPDQKMTNAQNAGAVAGIIWDDFPEGFYDIYDVYTTLSGINLLQVTTLPGGFITYEDGAALQQQLAAQSRSTASLNFNVLPVPLNSNRVAYLSSRGPNADFEIKPDLVAVGQDLLTATESINSGGNFYDATGLLYPANGTSGSTPLVSGAAAILKAARPGLGVLDYRSLIINSAAPINDVINGGLARVMDAGAGILDVNAALNAEATLSPASLSFGLGTTLTKSFTITNWGSAADTFHLSVVPRDPSFGVVPSVSPASLQLAPGASGTVQVTMPSGLGAGEYEGAIHVQAGNTTTDTHLMYWLGVPSQTPYLITDFGYDLTSYFPQGQLTTAAIAFRVTDAAGIYMNNILSQVTVAYNGTYNASTGAKVTGSTRAGSAYYLTDTTNPEYTPGVIAVDVTTSRGRGLYDEYVVTIGNPNSPTLQMTFDLYGQ
jgi:minor extracellular serine protease Vpr